ncbi:uncharacterized protein LOC124499637 isoform X1 [Dermatophagoides farinae]|uniref:uncharacterized protein LOC124499637 isoform X1 n=1 Tax=Dermatophagoides farinae TaxID=6954 RepID=UPI003F5EAB50
MEDNLFYGYLSYHRKDSKKNYSIRKRNITIGSQKTNDIRLKKGISDRKYLQLSIVNECNYKLDICTSVPTVRENIAIDDAKVFLEHESIQLKDGNVLSIFGLNFTFVANKADNKSNITKSASKIPVLNKLNLYSDKSCGSPNKNLATSFPLVCSTLAQNSKIPVSVHTPKLINLNDDTCTPSLAISSHENNDSTLQNDQQSCVAHMDDNDDNDSDNNERTFEIDRDESMLLKFNTPSSSKIGSKSLKSLLKTATPINMETTNRKSVVFNELVEENHSEYDSRTGQLFSSTKMSRKLFPISPDQQTSNDEQDELSVFLQHAEIDSFKEQSTLYQDAVTEVSITSQDFVSFIDSTMTKEQSDSESDELGQLSLTISNHDECKVDGKPDILVEKQLGTPVADYDSNVDYGVKKLQQPTTPMADYESNVDYGVKKLQQPTTPMADYDSNVDYGVKKLQQPTTPMADYDSNVDYGVKKLQQPTTPMADYDSNVDYGVKKLQQPTTPMADYDSNVDYGVKKLQQPTTPMADYESNVDYAIKKLQQPTTPLADYESNVDYGVKKLQQPTTPLANYESNVDYAIKKLQQPTTPMANYESNVDYAIKKLQQPTTPMADYVTYIDFGIKKLQKSITPLPEYDGNLSGFENLFSVDDSNMITPIKPRGRGRRPRQVQRIEDSENRILTRSAAKNKNKNEEKEPSTEKSAKCKKQSTGNKRRRKIDKDEIGLLIDSDNGIESDEVDIEKIRELAAINSKKPHVDHFRKRSRGSRKQSANNDRLQTIDIELDDYQLMDAMTKTPITSKKTKVKNATRKRKTATTMDESTSKNKTIKSKRKTKAKTNDDHDHDEDSNNEAKENLKNVVNCEPKPNEPRKYRYILPEVDFSMRLEQKEPNGAKGVVTRSRAKHIE